MSQTGAPPAGVRLPAIRCVSTTLRRRLSPLPEKVDHQLMDADRVLRGVAVAGALHDVQVGARDPLREHAGVVDRTDDGAAAMEYARRSLNLGEGAVAAP